MAEQKKPAKKTRSQDSDLLDVISQAADTPTYRPLMDYLAERRAIPVIREGYLGEAVAGEFERNTWSNGPLPAKGQITLNYGAGPNTLLHEVTHAAQGQVNSQASEDYQRLGDTAPLRKQFLEAYSKIQDSFRTRGLFDPPTETSQVRSMAKRLAPEFMEKASSYRGSTEELQAFAVGDASVPKPFSKAPQHLSPTLATEFMILLDLATRRQKETNAATPPPKTR